MSELGEISAEVRAALAELARVLDHFTELDRRQLAALEAELRHSPQTRSVAALIGTARAQVLRAERGLAAARASGSEWLAQHGSFEGGGSLRRSPGGGSSSPGSPVVEAIWAEGIDTPAGRAYFSADEPGMRESALAVPPSAGEYTVDIHGNSTGVGCGSNELDAAGLADLVTADPNWGGRPIRLFSCETGRGAEPIAAELARRLGVRVKAPDDLVWLTPDSEVVVAPILVKYVNGSVVKVPDRSQEGGWRVFDP